MSSPDRPAVSVVTARAVVERLAEGKTPLITRDQERVATRALEDADFSLLANRALLRGADPEFLRRTSARSFDALAGKLGLTIEEAEAAIVQAHRLGPGSFDEDSVREWLWLVMVMHSADEMDEAHLPPEEMMRRSAHCVVEFEQFVGREDGEDMVRFARAYRTEMLRDIQPIGVADQGEGIPLYDRDIGHYLAYRSGHHVAAVRAADGLVFYGTDGSLTLQDAGVEVDRRMSDFFGIVFSK